MSNIFTDAEIQESPESYNDDDYSSESYNDGNCPPGHYISIAHGGKGHWDGDGCCNESNPTANIDMGIFYLLIIAISFITYLKYRVS